MTTSYDLLVCNQRLQHLSLKGSAIPAARIINTTKGWMAHRGAEGRDDNAVNVSRLINQHAGAAQIAALLGL